MDELYDFLAKDYPDFMAGMTKENFLKHYGSNTAGQDKLYDVLDKEGITGGLEKEKYRKRFPLSIEAIGALKRDDDNETKVLNLGPLDDTAVGDYIEDQYRAMRRGWSQGAGVGESLQLVAKGKGASEKNIQEFVDKVKENRKYDISKEFREFMDADGFVESTKALGKNIVTIVPELIFETSAALIRGGGAVMLGAAGAIGGSAGTLAPLAIPLAAFAASSSLETASKVMEGMEEYFGENDLDFSPESVEKVLNDADAWSEIRKKAIVKGATIGLVDAAFAGMVSKLGGSKLLKEVAKKSEKTGIPISKKLINAVNRSTLTKQVGLDVVGGSGGELLSQPLIGEDLDFKAAIIEGIAELPSAGATVWGSRAIDKKRAGAIADNEMARAVIENQPEYFKSTIDFSKEIGHINEDQANELLNNYQEFHDLNQSIPSTVTDKGKRVQILGKIRQRKNLENLSLDPTFSGEKADAIGQINTEIENIKNGPISEEAKTSLISEKEAIELNIIKNKPEGDSLTILQKRLGEIDTALNPKKKEEEQVPPATTTEATEEVQKPTEPVFLSQEQLEGKTLDVLITNDKGEDVVQNVPADKWQNTIKRKLDSFNKLEENKPLTEEQKTEKQEWITHLQELPGKIGVELDTKPVEAISPEAAVTEQVEANVAPSPPQEVVEESVENRLTKIGPEKLPKLNGIKQNTPKKVAEVYNKAKATPEANRTKYHNRIIAEVDNLLLKPDTGLPASARPIVRIGDLDGMEDGAKKIRAFKTKKGEQIELRVNEDGEVFAVNSKKQVIGFATKLSDKEADLATVVEYQQQGVGTEVLKLFNDKNPNFPTGGLTPLGRKTLEASKRPRKGDKIGTFTVTDSRTGNKFMDSNQSGQVEPDTTTTKPPIQESRRKLTPEQEVKPFAVFVVTDAGDGAIAVTTRDPKKEPNKIGLPGGKVDLGETPQEAVKREAREEGWEIEGDLEVIASDMVEGRPVVWYGAPSARKLSTYKEQSRGIEPRSADAKTVSTSGYGNDFVENYWSEINAPRDPSQTKNPAPLEATMEAVHKSEAKRLPDLEKIPYEQRTDMEHASYIKAKLRAVFKKAKRTDEEIDATLALLEAHAKINNPENPEAYYRKIEDVGEGTVTPEGDVLYQEGTDKKGATVTLNNGRKLILALKNPDFSTMIHELAHIFEDELTEAQRKVVQDWAGTVKWTKATSEVFARGFERYLRDGNAPTPILQELFQKAKLWLQEIYKSVIGSPIERDITPEIKEIFDSLLSGESIRYNKAKAIAVDAVIDRNVPISKLFFDSMLTMLGSKMPTYQRTTLANLIRESIALGHHFGSTAFANAMRIIGSIKDEVPQQRLTEAEIIGMAYAAESNRLKLNQENETIANKNYAPLNGVSTFEDSKKNIYNYDKGVWKNIDTKEVYADQNQMTQDFMEYEKGQDVNMKNAIEAQLETLYTALTLSASHAGLTLNLLGRVIDGRKVSKQKYINEIETNSGKKLTQEELAKIDRDYERLERLNAQERILQDKMNSQTRSILRSMAKEILKNPSRKQITESLEDIIKEIKRELNPNIQFQSEADSKLLSNLNKLLNKIIQAETDPENLNINTLFPKGKNPPKGFSKDVDTLFKAVKDILGSDEITDDLLLQAFTTTHPKRKAAAKAAAEQLTNDLKARLKKEARLIKLVDNMVNNHFQRRKTGKKIDSKEVTLLNKWIEELRHIALTDPHMTLEESEIKNMSLSQLQSMYDSVLFSRKIFTNVDEVTVRTMANNFRNYLTEGKEINDTKSIFRRLDKALADEIKVNAKTIPSDHMVRIREVKDKINSLVTQKDPVSDKKKQEVIAELTALSNMFAGSVDHVAYALTDFNAALSNLKTAKDKKVGLTSIQNLKEKLDKMLSNEFDNESEKYNTPTTLAVSRLKRMIREASKQISPDKRLIHDIVKELDALAEQFPRLNKNFPEPITGKGSQYSEQDLEVILSNLKDYEQVRGLNRKLASTQEKIEEASKILRLINQGDEETALAMLLKETPRSGFTSPELQHKRTELRLLRENLLSFKQSKTMSRAGRYAYNANTFYRALVLSMDASFAGVHGGLFLITNAVRSPIESLNFFRHAFLAAKKDENFYKIHENLIFNDPSYAASQHLANDLRIASLGGKFSTGVEEFPSDVVRRIPLIGAVYSASERAFTTYVNLLRFHLFKTYHMTNPLATKEEMSIVVDQINTYTGGSRVGFKSKSYEGSLEALSYGVIAPRLYFSMFKTYYNLTLLPDIARYTRARLKGEDTARAYAYRLKESAMVLMGLSLPYIAAMMFDADVEDDPRDSQFMAIQYKDRSINPNPLTSYFRVIGKLFIKALNSVGIAYSEEPEDQMFTNLTATDILMDWGKYKLSPLPQTVLTGFTGKTAVGEPLYGRTVGEHFINIPNALLPKPIVVEQTSEFLPNWLKRDWFGFDAVEQDRGNFSGLESTGMVGLALLGFGAFSYNSKYQYVKVEQFLEGTNTKNSVRYRTSTDPDWTKMTHGQTLNPMAYYFRRDFQARMGEYILNNIEDGSFIITDKPAQIQKYKDMISGQGKKIRTYLKREYAERYDLPLK